MVRRGLWIAAMLSALAVLSSACAGGSSLTEYAEEMEGLVHSMNQRLDDALRTEPSPSTVEWTQSFWADRADVRWEFIAAARELEVPDSVADLHDAALDLVTQLATAETALAELALTAETMDDVRALAEGPEAAAFDEIDARVVEFCRAAQAHFDATESAEAFADVPFIPTEMQEVIEVAFRCTAEERGVTP